MAFKDRISSMFRRGSSGKSGRKGKHKQAAQGDQPTSDDEQTEPDGGEEDLLPSRADQEERQALMESLEHSFRHVGTVLERMDRHLEAGNESLPAILEGQQRLAEGNREMVSALGEHLRQRDEAQQALLERLKQLGDGLESQRSHEQRQLDLVMGVQRSNRRLMVLIIGLGFLLVLLLLAALIFVMMSGLAQPSADKRQSDQRAHPAEQDWRLGELHRAAQSSDPQISARADAALARIDP